MTTSHNITDNCFKKERKEPFRMLNIMVRMTLNSYRFVYLLAKEQGYECVLNIKICNRLASSSEFVKYSEEM